MIKPYNPLEIQPIRDLTKTYLELVAQKDMIKKRTEWEKHNALQGATPRVLIFPENAWFELIDEKSLQATHPVLRYLEYELLKKIYHLKHFRDDSVFDAHFYLPEIYNPLVDWCGGQQRLFFNNPAGDVFYRTPENNRIESPETLLKCMSYRESPRGGEKIKQQLEDTFGDLITFEYVIPYLSASMIYDVLRAYDFMEFVGLLAKKPNDIHKVMRQYTDGILEHLKALEQGKKLTRNTTGQYLPSGTVGALPSILNEGKQEVSLKALWGYADTQEFTSISPKMWREFVFPYQKEILEKFGYVYYGCCDPLEHYLDELMTLSNLRKVSISPWTDMYRVQEKIKGKYIGAKKINSAIFMDYDEKNAEKEIKELLRLFDHSPLEIVLRDVESCLGHPENLSRWIDLTQNLCK
jgi:hypothetical protein